MFWYVWVFSISIFLSFDFFWQFRLFDENFKFWELFLCGFLEVNLAILPGGHAQFLIFTKYFVVLGLIWFHKKNRNSEKLKFSKKTWNCQQNRNSEKAKLKKTQKMSKVSKKSSKKLRKSLDFQKVYIFKDVTILTFCENFDMFWYVLICFERSELCFLVNFKYVFFTLLQVPPLNVLFRCCSLIRELDIHIWRLADSILDRTGSWSAGSMAKLGPPHAHEQWVIFWLRKKGKEGFYLYHWAHTWQYDKCINTLVQYKWHSREPNQRRLRCQSNALPLRRTRLM